MQNEILNGPLDRSKPIEAQSKDIITRRMEEIMKYPSERLALENLSWEHLIAFAQGKPTQEVIDKSRTIVNILSCEPVIGKKTIIYEAKSKLSAEIEKCAQIYAYVRSIAIILEDQNHSAAGHWLDEYRKSISDSRDYIIDNQKEAKEKWEGRAQSSNPKEIEKWRAEYTYSLLMATVFKCALKIDSALASNVKRLNDSLERSENEYRNLACTLGTFMLCCTSNEDKRLLDSNNGNCLPQTICITASVIITITALALGFGLGLGLGQ